MKNAVLAGLFGCVGMIAISFLTANAVNESSPAVPSIVEALDRETTAEQQTRRWSESLAQFRHAELWREVYQFDGSADRFCRVGEYARHGKVYRTPKIPTQSSTEFQGRFGGPVDVLPLDGERLFLTIVYRDRRSDPASQHLANIFTMQGHWLNELISSTHYRRVDAPNDPLWREYIAPQFGIRESDLPCVLLTEPPDKSTPQGRSRMGRVVYYAPAWSMPWHPDQLAYEIATHIAKRPPTAATTDVSAFPRGETLTSGQREYGQCVGPFCPRHPPETPPPEIPLLPPIRPNIEFPLGDNMWLMVIVGLALLAFAAFALGRRR